MGFESWETKFGVVVLHGDVKKHRRNGLCRCFVFFVRQLRSKLPKNPRTRYIVKLRLKNEKQSIKINACSEEGWTLLVFFKHQGTNHHGIGLLTLTSNL